GREQQECEGHPHPACSTGAARVRKRHSEDHGAIVDGSLRRVRRCRMSEAEYEPGGRRAGGDAEVTGRTTPSQSRKFAAAALLAAAAAFSACGAGPERARDGAAGGPASEGGRTTPAGPSEASEAAVRPGID